MKLWNRYGTLSERFIIFSIQISHLRNYNSNVIIHPFLEFFSALLGSNAHGFPLQILLHVVEPALLEVLEAVPLPLPLLLLRVEMGESGYRPAVRHLVASGTRHILLLFRKSIFLISEE
jgi:hypothetical protein